MEDDSQWKASRRARRAGIGWGGRGASGAAWGARVPEGRGFESRAWPMRALSCAGLSRQLGGGVWGGAFLPPGAAAGLEGTVPAQLYPRSRFPQNLGAGGLGEQRSLCVPQGLGPAEGE